MAYDLVKKKRVAGDWCCGIGDDDIVGSDLPRSTKGYAPETFWKTADMEAKVAEFMSKARGPLGLGGKPTRAEAVKMLAEHMRDNKIGVQVSGVGSVLLSSSEQQRLYNKIDDVRYDIRRAGALAGAGIAAIAGSVAVLGLAEMWRVVKGRA